MTGLLFLIFKPVALRVALLLTKRLQTGHELVKYSCRWQEKMSSPGECLHNKLNLWPLWTLYCWQEIFTIHRKIKNSYAYFAKLGHEINVQQQAHNTTYYTIFNMKDYSERELRATVNGQRDLRILNCSMPSQSCHKKNVCLTTIIKLF